jgi:hypothetical protein
MGNKTFFMHQLLSKIGQNVIMSASNEQCIAIFYGIASSLLVSNFDKI